MADHVELRPQVSEGVVATEIRLPTEAEWWLAATNGGPANLYAWGREWQAGCTNSREIKLGRPISVGLHPFGSAPCGAQDMEGNVWEWCLNEFEHPEQVELQGTARRALWGGSYLDTCAAMSCTSRVNQFPLSRNNASGYRVMCEIDWRMR